MGVIVRPACPRRGVRQETRARLYVYQLPCPMSHVYRPQATRHAGMANPDAPLVLYEAYWYYPYTCAQFEYANTIIVRRTAVLFDYWYVRC
jgi:hypothetical protein